MIIAILRTDSVIPELAARFGEYPDMFMRLLRTVEAGLTFRIFDVQHAQYPTDLRAADAYLITGSRAAVYERAPWIARLQEFVRALGAEHLPTIGICFGHQLIAQALGGRVGRAANGWGVGVQTAQWYRHPPWLTATPPTLRLLASHQDQVIKPAPGAVVLAGSPFCPVAACQLGNHLLSFQGHPEFVPGYARGLLEQRRETLGEALFQRAVASLTEPTDSLSVARGMLAFIRQGRVGGPSGSRSGIA